jgi:hypothetical protein
VLHEAVKESNVANVMRSQGVDDLQPAWAKGRFVLVNGADWENGADWDRIRKHPLVMSGESNQKSLRRQVIIYDDNFDALCDDLKNKGLTNKARKVKPNRQLLLQTSVKVNREW